jgi:hypothetical protein
MTCVTNLVSASVPVSALRYKEDFAFRLRNLLGDSVPLWFASPPSIIRDSSCYGTAYRRALRVREDIVGT